MVAAVLTVLGFFLYSFLSFQRRLLQMGILRAIGLSSAQLFVLLMFEQVFLILLGVAAGTGFGLWTSNLFIPFLQVSADVNGQVPKFVVETAWSDIGADLHRARRHARLRAPDHGRAAAPHEGLPGRQARRAGLGASSRARLPVIMPRTHNRTI